MQVGQRSAAKRLCRCTRRAEHPGQRFTAPGQWEGLAKGDGGPRQEAVAILVTVGDVEHCSLDVYDLPALGDVR